MRKAYPPTPQVQQSVTAPPKAYDMKFYSEYVDPEDDFNWNPEKILFSFTFGEEDAEARSPAYEFLIEIENLDTGVVKSFVQLADVSVYRFWQRQAEVYTLSPDNPEDEIDLLEESIVNSRIIVTPINDFGDGLKSTFILPFRDLTWTRSKDNVAEGTFSVMNTNWHLFSEDPDNRINRPKTMYIYLDVDESDIELDRLKLNREEYSYDSLTDYKTINNATYRWSVSGLDYRKLSKDGWGDMNQEEKEFIVDLVQTMLPYYRNYITKEALLTDDDVVFKMAIENPDDNRDSIIIYLMKGTRWKT